MSISFPNVPLPKVSANQIKTFASSILAAFIIMVILSQSLFTVPSGFVGVKYSLGKISPDELQPGMHLIMPFADHVRLFDTKSQTVNYNGKHDKPDSDGVINLAGIGILDEKNLLIALDVTVQFTPKGDKADEIVSQIGWNYYEKRLNSIVRDVVRDVAGKYQAETIASNRTEINSKMKAELARNMEGTPFILNELSLRDISLPKVIMEKVEAVQSAKQEEQRLGMVLKQTEQNQKISTMNAETKLIEATTAARAEAERLRLVSEGNAKAILTEAEAQAKANEVVAKSVTPTLIEYNAVKAWNGAPPQTLVNGGGQSIPNMILGIQK